MSNIRSARRGFNTFNKVASNLNNVTFKVADDSEVIAFLEDENFAYALRHWVKFIDPESGQQRTVAEWCLEDDCPLCDIGDRAKPTAFFNVVNLATPGKVLVWEATADPTKAIEKEYSKLQRKGQNLNDEDLFWVVSKEKGRNNIPSYSVDKLPLEDLEVEWPSLTPLTAEQRESLSEKLYDETYIKFKTREELEDLASKLD